MIINISLLPVFLLFNIFALKFSYILCIVNVQCRLYSIRAGYKWRNAKINFHFRFHSYYTVFIRILCTHFHSNVEAKVSNCHFISFPMRFMFSSSARFKFIISICLNFNFFSAASLCLLFTLLFFLSIKFQCIRAQSRCEENILTDRHKINTSLIKYLDN